MSTEVENDEKEFLAEAEVMNLAPIREKTFCVAVATGQPNGTKYLASTLHGPYTFVEMVQEVGEMWVTHQHHAKAIVLNKDNKSKLETLDANTIDYIEAHYLDIILEETLTSYEDKEFTCSAGTSLEVEPEKT